MDAHFAGVNFTGARFRLGQIVATPGALDALDAAGVSAGALLSRHVIGDWGDIPAEDAEENEFSVGRRLRLLSAYTLPNKVRVWVITEADRSVTTLLLPDEY